MKRIYIVLAFLFLMPVPHVWASLNVDSTRQVLTKISGDEAKLNAALYLADYYSRINRDSALHYLNLADRLRVHVEDIRMNAYYYLEKAVIEAKEASPFNAIDAARQSIHFYGLADDTKGKVKAYTMLGIIYSQVNISDSAFHYFNSSLQLLDSVTEAQSYAAVLNNLANLYDDNNDPSKAILYYTRSIELFEELHDSARLATAYTNLFRIFTDLEDHRRALAEGLKASSYLKNSKDVLQKCILCNTFGLLYRGSEVQDSAVYYFRKGLNLALQGEFPSLVAQFYHNIGSVYLHEGLMDSAYANLNRSLAICDSMILPEGKMHNHELLGELYMEVGDYRMSEKNYLIALHLAEQLKIMRVKTTILLNLGDLYHLLNNQEQAYRYLKDYVTLVDSLDAVRNQSRIADALSRVDARRQNMANKSLQQLNDKQRYTILMQRVTMMVIVAGIILTMLIILMLVVKRRRRLKQMRILEEKNRTIALQAQQLEESNRSKDVLFSIISHDLRNPFNALIGLGELLDLTIEEADMETLKMYSEQINLSIKNFYVLLENLLEWSRSQSNRITVRDKKVSPHKLIADIITSFHFNITNKELQVTNETDSDLIMTTDPEILSVVLRNLINNSIKFTPEEGHIIIKSSVEEGQVHLTVIDSGVGISKEMEEKIMQQADLISTMGTRDEKGSGLGMVLITEFTRMLGGSVRILSEVHNGSMITISLPLN